RAQELVVRPVTGATETEIFNWADDRCREWDIPDAPFRAFRDARNQVVAFASSDTNNMFVGSSLSELGHRCHSSLTSIENADPAVYSGLRFITSTWTFDGKNVVALVHNEYHAEHFKNCAYGQSMLCWYTTIIGAYSDDGGVNFKVDSQPNVVAG